MKKTSYETSKKLAEAGFKAETEFYWVKWNEGEPELVHEKEQTPALIEKVGAWDLETILEALPKNIITYPDEKITEQPIEKLRLEMDEIGYYFSDKDDYGRDNCFTYLHREESESLADCAAKMWLKLKKENLI
jgi:hypothetical protein